MEKILTFFEKYWKLLAISLFVVALSYVLLFRSLGTLLPGYDLAEVTSKAQSISLRTIYENPVDAPYKLLVWTGNKLDHHGLLVTRIAAGLLAIPVAVLFYWVALHWYSKRVAFLSSILFISSSGFLHFGRFGTGLILQMSTLLLISAVFLYRRAKHETLMAYMFATILAVCLYIPGFVWIVTVGAVVLRRSIPGVLAKLGKTHAALIGLLVLAIVAPLLWVGFHTSSVALAILGLPTALPSIREVVSEILHLGSSIVYRGYWDPAYWLYGSPLLNIGEVILFVAGLFMLINKPILRQNYFILGALALGSALVVLGGSVTIALLVPLIYLVIAGGIFYLLDQWLTVFPRNPVARYIGIGIICILAAFSAMYHLRAYYTAWPNNPKTKQVYIIQQPS